jgi:glyoxylase-like metal-dependent hydrolase (beta-lactamase superfamily II)
MSVREFRFVNTYRNFMAVGTGHIPAFICSDDPPIIIDPGVSAFGPLYFRTLQQDIKGQKHPLIILLTHSHFDHCGATPYLLKKFPDVKVGASIRAAEVFQKPSAIELMKIFNAEYEEQMAHELEEEDTTFSGITVDVQLKEGDMVDLGNGKHVQVIETPGHTRDCLSYYFPECGVLIAGEAAGVPDGDFIHSVFLTSYLDYVRSIQKLSMIEAEALCIAHVGILEGRDTVQEYLSASLRATQEYRTKIERYLEQFDGDKEKVVNTIVAEEYDSRQNHIVNRNPFITNLQAKVNAVYKLSEK